MAYRFNPPPNWPVDEPGWTPPPGWQPDPSWGPAPEGWDFWVDEAEQPGSDAGALGTDANAGDSLSGDVPASGSLDSGASDASHVEDADPTHVADSGETRVPLDDDATRPADSGQPSVPSASDASSEAPSAPSFGSEPDAPYESAAPVFGGASDAAGAGQGSASDAAQAPAYGAASPNAYGQGQAPAYGAASPNAYGQEQAPAYGTASPNAYGQEQAPAYGATSPNAYGQEQAPAYGTASPNAYGTDGTQGSWQSPAPIGGGPQKKSFLARFWWLGCILLAILALIVGGIVWGVSKAFSGSEASRTPDTTTTAPADPSSTDPATTDPASTDPATTDPASSDPASTAPAAPAPAGNGVEQPVSGPDGTGALTLSMEWKPGEEIPTEYGTTTDPAKNGNYLMVHVHIRADQGQIAINPNLFQIVTPYGGEIGYDANSFSVQGGNLSNSPEYILPGAEYDMVLLYDLPVNPGLKLVYTSYDGATASWDVPA